MNNITETYNNFFKLLTGFELYAFQKELFDNYCENNSFILQAPTGSGKTLAAITPFCYSWSEWKAGKQNTADYPRKLIYSLPLRALANSLYDEVGKLFKDKLSELNLRITLQTGEYSDDPFFEGDIIFTTIDQTLSSFLSIPLSLPNKLANINAGAVISSFLIFDEFHLLEPKKALSTTIIILNKLKKITPFCIMTATLTNSFISKISGLLSCKTITLKPEDIAQFSYMKNKQRRIISLHEEFLTEHVILDLHQNKTIIICNTVASCVTLAKKTKIEIINKGKDIKVICLHSRFFQKDRAKKEKEIIFYFGNNSQIGNVILFTTQIVEVGLDISCDVMLTEVSPVNSFIQRAGRSARWGGDSCIHVFKCENTYKPYNKNLSLKTFEELNKHNNSLLDFELSGQLIETILTEEELKIYDEISNNSEIQWKTIVQSWLTGNKSFANQLIREILSTNVVIINDTGSIRNLYQFASIPIHPKTLINSLLKIIDEFEDEIPDLVFKMIPSTFIGFNDNEENMQLSPVRVEDIEYENILALNADYIGYSEFTGLDFNDNFGIISEKRESDSIYKQYVYSYDTFEEHIVWMLNVFQEMYSCQYPIGKIKSEFYDTDYETLMVFMIVVHDFGKLNDLWQRIIQGYQYLKCNEHCKTPLAHSDYDSQNENDVNFMREVLKKNHSSRKPDHAGIGARFVYYTLPRLMEMKRDRYCEEIVKMTATAVLRHHAAFTEQASSFNICKDSLAFFSKLLYSYFPEMKKIDFLSLPIYKSNIRSKDYSINFSDPYISFLYFMFVRILRLTDQKSFSKNPRLGGQE